MLEKIASYIVKAVQKESILNGFQYTVGYEEVEKEFNITVTTDMAKEIEMELGCCEEVADVLTDDYGFDVVLYTSYTQNYDEEDYE